MMINAFSAEDAMLLAQTVAIKQFSLMVTTQYQESLKKIAQDALSAMQYAQLKELLQ